MVFSGTSADELFTGYYDHYLLHLFEVRNHPDYATYESDWRTHVAPSVRNPMLKNPQLYSENPDARSHNYFDPSVFSNFLLGDFAEDFFEEKYCEGLLRNRMLNELFHEATPVILHEDDLNSMFFSIENRSPFLDSKLFEFAYSIPEEHLIKGGFNKFVLREAVKGILNDQVRLDRRKKGFNASISSVVDFSDKQTRETLLDNSPIFEIFDREKVAKLFDMEFIPNTYSKFLFGFINAKMFLESKHF